MQQNTFTLELSIQPDRAGTYFTLPFTMPAGVEAMTLRYQYERHRESDAPVQGGTFTARQEINIIDLGLIAPDGTQVGTSGSDKTEISISETRATLGYHPTLLIPGEWQIIVGAYKVAPEGVTVTYELIFTLKHLRLLKGDLHAHTLASDGVLTAEELGQKAMRHGLDFVAITDHNQPISPESLPQIPGLTLIPGLEWTHYQGHANFLGIEQPFDGAFFTNTQAEALAHFDAAHERGALITINHPFEPCCPFVLDYNHLPFDLLEIWNGPMREPNLKAIALWQSMLEAGQKIPAVGGSDYHRDTPFIILGGPTTCVYALSTGPSDILAALKQGHAYIIFAPNGPTLEMTAGGAILGDTVPWPQIKEMQLNIGGLVAGDVVRVVTGGGSTNLLQAASAGRFRGSYPIEAPGFARVEVLRAFLPGLPLLPALISNPIYFEG